MSVQVKRYLSVILSLSLWLSLMLSVQLPVMAAYENTHHNTENQAYDIVAVAQTQIGYQEGSNNNNKYGAAFGHNNVAWCAYFVSWCAKEAGISDSIIHRQGIASPFSGYFNIPNTHSSGSYFPKPGDLVFYGPNSNGDHYHVGIVETVNASTGYITTIEGNTNSGGSSEGHIVYRHTRHYQASSICCYGKPNYTNSSIQRTIDSRYSPYLPMGAFPISDSNISVYDEYGTKYSNRYIYGATDPCVISAIYTDGWCKVTYPSESSGTFTAYVPFSTFVSSPSLTSWTADKQYSAYRKSNLYTAIGDKYGTVSQGAICLQVSRSGDVRQIIYRSSGQYMMGWINAPDHAQTPTIRWWLSDTEYGDTVSTYKTGNRYYFCYRMYDEVSGKNWDEVETSNYTVRLTFYNPDGSVKYTNSGVFDYDQSWISSFFEDPGIYKIGVVIEGDYIFTGTRSFTVEDNPIIVRSSARSVNLSLGGTETQTVYVWDEGYYKGNWVISWQRSNSNVNCAWGDWTEDGKLPLTLTANAAGAAVVTIRIKDKTTDEVLSSTTININVGAKTYTVSYNANGGSGAPSSQTKSHGTALTLSTTVPERLGYTFLGWSTSSSSTSATYVPGGSFSTNANTTLYAVWQVASTISSSVTNSSYSASVSFVNGYKYYSITPSVTGKYRFESTGSLDTQVYIYDVSGNQLTKNDDSGEGNNFLLTYQLTAGSKYYVKVKLCNSGTGTVNFTVKRVYDVTYNANNGSGAPSPQEKIHGTSLTLNSTKPTWTGYTFCGWATNATATSATYQPGGNFTTNANTTLYAVWERGCENSSHSYSYAATKNPTTSATGTLTGTCSKCKGTTTVTLPKLTTTDYTYVVKTAVTCTADGTATYTWNTTTYGSFSFNVTLTKTGHSYSNGTCSHCGADDPDYIKVGLIGDISGDGRVNIGDVAKLYSHIKGTSILTGDILEHCDISGDGRVNIGDVAKLYSHIKGTSMLY